MKRRLGLVLVVAAVLFLGRLFERRPRAVDLALAIEGRPTRVVLVFTDEAGDVIRGLALDAPEPGAHRQVSLRPGRYRVGARIEQGAAVRTLSRTLEVGAEGGHTVDLRGR